MSECPLVKIEGVGGVKVEVERAETGWFFRTPHGLQARLRDYRDLLVCRIAPPQDRDVVQLGVGAASSALCNAVYLPTRDCALQFKADELEIVPVYKGARLQYYAVSCAGPLNITVREDYLRIHHNLPWYRPLQRKRFPRPPAGWCSWYYYYLGINETELIKNTDWLTEHLQPYGCEWVQIDDGWQGRGDGFGSNRDWFVTCEQDFPHGMKWCADYIRANGMRPGIWCIPFTQSNQELYKTHRGLFVHKDDGRSPGERDEPLDYDWMPVEERKYEWAGRYFIDPTSVQGEQYLRKLFEMFCKDWGYEYVKIDAQGGMADFYDLYRNCLADPSMDGARAYRFGLEVMRTAMGPNRFLLNCAQGWASAGICEGMRIGGDVGLNWEAMQPAIDSTMQWLYLNTLAFYTDPDVVCVREPLPLEHARLWAELVCITGQLLMTSDQMYSLPPERVELLRRIFPVADVRPMELYPLDTKHKPGIFDLKVRQPGVGQWDVVALFNWDTAAPRTVELSPQRLGLPEGEWLALDGWSGEVLHIGDGKLNITLPPAHSQVLTYWPLGILPQFVGSSRHLLQGAVDVESVQWDERRLRLLGTVHVVGGDPYRLRIFVPEGFRVRSRNVEVHGPIAELVITRQKNTKVRWQVEFARM